MLFRPDDRVGGAGWQKGDVAVAGWIVLLVALVLVADIATKPAGGVGGGVRIKGPRFPIGGTKGGRKRGGVGG